jgi:colanic acid/amylovoran biosynthesis glycosyltransferase
VLTVAYLANRFPVTVEPYVGEEIEELRRRGIHIIACSARKSGERRGEADDAREAREILSLQPVEFLSLLRALALLLRRRNQVADLMARIFFQGRESPQRRVRALLHTCLGAYYAVKLQKRRVDHIHVHHGYFGSWIAMVAARLLGIEFSLTLHGSDLLTHRAYLDAKLRCCRFCVTVSEYNRQHILQGYPEVDPGKIMVSRLGVDVPKVTESPPRPAHSTEREFTMLSVGRLHAVKDHAFLVRACTRLRDSGTDFQCAIAGAGPERQRLEKLIHECRLQDRVRLLGAVPRSEMDALYRRADLVVLTSRSEGIPLVLMEAMAQGRIVLAPAITGIPELVIPGKTGFLYSPGAIDDLASRIVFIEEMMRAERRYAVSRLDWIRHAARVQVLHNFNRRKNLNNFCERFLERIGPHEVVPKDWSPPHESAVLQQI